MKMEEDGRYVAGELDDECAQLEFIRDVILALCADPEDVVKNNCFTNLEKRIAELKRIDSD